MNYDAILYVSFGGPEGRDDVMPYLENVVRGRPFTPERLHEVAHHYEQFGGVSPINQQNREVITALEKELDIHRIWMPVYFGNRNWHPLLADTMREMAANGVKRALAFVTSAFSCYSGCRQYRENIEAARTAAGDAAPVVDKLRVFYNHPRFVEANAARVRDAAASLPDSGASETCLVFTAHSIPLAMARGSRYETQLHDACGFVAGAAEMSNWRLAYQSRSGSPKHPWLEPDVCDVIRALAASGVQRLILSPIGFVTDHMEVIYDLDTEARAVANEAGVEMVRAGTAGTHPAYISMIRELIEERLKKSVRRRALGGRGPSHDVCPAGCCAYEPVKRSAPLV